MDRLPQEIIDHIVSYLAPRHLRLKSPYDKKRTATSASSSSSPPSISASSSTTSLSSTLTGTSSRYSASSSSEPTTSLAPLATISRKWQKSIERLTFPHIRLASDELPTFRKTFSSLSGPSGGRHSRQQRRQHLLKSLTFDIVLPSYSREASTRIETLAERRANDVAYTTAIRALFRVLKTWEIEDPSLAAGVGDSKNGLRLCINHPFSRSDRPYSVEGEWDWADSVLDGSNAGSTTSTRASIHEGRYFHHHIALLPDDPSSSPSSASSTSPPSSSSSISLPVLHSISELVMKQPPNRWGFRMTYAKVPYLLASRMPNLEAIDIDVSDNEKRFPTLRRQNRLELAAVMAALDLPRLKRAEMLFFQMRWRDQRVAPPVLTVRDGGDGEEYDPLSRAICELAGRAGGLTDLTVTGVVDPGLLRGLPDDGAGKKKGWKQMRRLEINFYETTPSGGWYFTGRPPRDALPPQFDIDDWTTTDGDSGNMVVAQDVSELGDEQFSFAREAGLAAMEPRNVFRTTPCAETMAPLVEAFAEATARMPRLKTAMLNCTTDSAEFNFAGGGGLFAEDGGSGRPDWFVLAYMEPTSPREPAAGRRVDEMMDGDAERLSAHMTTRCRRTRSTSQAAVQRQLVTSLMGWQPTKQLQKKLTTVQPDSRAEVVVEKDMDTWLMEQGQLPIVVS